MQKEVEEVREITEEEIDTFDQMWALWDVDHSGELDKEELRVVRPRPTPQRPAPPRRASLVGGVELDITHQHHIAQLLSGVPQCPSLPPLNASCPSCSAGDIRFSHASAVGCGYGCEG